MERYGIFVDVKNVPALDPEFIPILKFNRAFLKDAAKPVSIAVERAGGQIATMGLTFIVVIPLVILVAGAVVVIRRRAR